MGGDALTDPARTSPTAKTPGMEVSKGPALLSVNTDAAGVGEAVRAAANTRRAPRHGVPSRQSWISSRPSLASLVDDCGADRAAGDEAGDVAGVGRCVVSR